MRDVSLESPRRRHHEGSRAETRTPHPVAGFQYIKRPTAGAGEAKMAGIEVLFLSKEDVDRVDLGLQEVMYACRGYENPRDE